MIFLLRKWLIKKKVIVKKDIEIIPVSCVVYLQPSATDERLSDTE